MKKLLCVYNPPILYEFMLHESNDGHPAAEADCPDLQEYDCETEKRKLSLCGLGLAYNVHFQSPMVRMRELVLYPRPSPAGEISGRGY